MACALAAVKAKAKPRCPATIDAMQIPKVNMFDKDGQFHVNLDDDIVAACLMCRDGEAVRKNA